MASRNLRKVIPRVQEGGPLKKKRRQRYELEDAEARRRVHPITFEIPDRVSRMNLRPGDQAKLIFLAPVPDYVGLPTRLGGERMWVDVTARLKETARKVTYEGILRNHPVMIRGLSFGEIVMFDSSHIIDIESDQSQRRRRRNRGSKTIF